MNGLAKKLESLANIAIIIVAVLLSIVLVKNYLFNKSDNSAQVANNSQTLAGTKITLPDIDWAKNGQTLVLAVSSTCHYCTESAPFYKRLAQSKSNARLVAVLPQSVEDGRKYLEKLGVSADEVRQLPLDEIGVQGTPTLLLVDNSGIVKNFWIGMLLPDQQEAVLDALQSKHISFNSSARKEILQNRQ